MYLILLSGPFSFSLSLEPGWLTVMCHVNGLVVWARVYVYYLFLVCVWLWGRWSTVRTVWESGNRDPSPMSAALLPFLLPTTYLLLL